LLCNRELVLFKEKSWFHICLLRGDLKTHGMSNHIIFVYLCVGQWTFYQCGLLWGFWAMSYTFHIWREWEPKDHHVVWTLIVGKLTTENHQHQVNQGDPTEMLHAKVWVSFLCGNILCIDSRNTVLSLVPWEEDNKKLQYWLSSWTCPMDLFP
jgi:hypothetical protein